jgi:NADP-reducing hydrogenase subunit HndB
MKSIEELRALREKTQKQMRARDTENKPKIIIGMGTCGIAAGARKVLEAVMTEVNKKDLDVLITQTGCIGMCEKEPLVDIKMPGEPRITYGNVNPEDVVNIIESHIMNGNVLQSKVIAQFDE